MPAMASSEPITSSPDVLVLCSKRTVLGERISPATLVISPASGKIIAVHETVLPRTSFPTSTRYLDISPLVLMPGIVDTHVHLNEPGRTEWEGFWTGTRAAAAGGVTTLIDMPLNAIPPTTTVENLRIKLAAARDQCWIDVGFYGGVIPGNEQELVPLVRAGVRGFKGFLCESGVEEFPMLDLSDVKKVFEALAEEKTTVMFHAEMTAPGDNAIHQSGPIIEESGDPYAIFLESRPPELETRAIAAILDLASRVPHPALHVVHLSAVEAIPLLRAARQRGIKITAETCFHYLAWTAEEITATGDTRHKCCPPIRSSSNQDLLWEELMAPDSVIRTVVSDHSPCTPELKLLPAAHAAIARLQELSADRDFMSAWGGISSVGLGLSILWTRRAERLAVNPTCAVPDLPTIARWCSSATAEQVGLSHRKGRLAAGLDADILVFDDEACWTLGKGEVLFKNKCSPYQEREFEGRVVQTWLRGRKIWDLQTGFTDTRPLGQLLTEPMAT